MDRINVAVSQTFLFTTSLKAALRLTVNPFGSQASHFPYITTDVVTQGETLLWFKLLTM